MSEALIDYQCAAYRKQAHKWRFIDDVYHGDSSWTDGGQPTKLARQYLPQLEGETDKQYKLRFAQSYFSDSFASAVRDFVGIVFSNGLELVDVPDQILANWDGLDGDRMDGHRLAAFIALRSLRFGHSFALIDFPGLDESIATLADSQASGRFPYWNPISPLQVINWRYHFVGRRRQLAWAVVRFDETVSAGDYGEASSTTYLLLRPGRFDLFEVTKDKAGKLHQRHLLDRSGEMGLRRRGFFEPFTEIPLVPLYGGDRTGFFESNPTLYAMARLNVHHYQVRSDHRHKMHECCFPNLYRVGGDGTDMVRGPRTIIDVPIGGAVGWAEPNSTSLSVSRTEVKDIEEEISFLGADYLVQPGDRQAATTSLMQSAKLASELFLFASDFALGLDHCLAWHARYLGLSAGGKTKLKTELFREMGDSQLLQNLIQMRLNQDLTSAELRTIANRKYDLFKEDV
jgi:Domain of unknown function (DUF4055)